MSRKVVVLTAGLSQPSSTRLLADQLAAAVSAAVGGRGESVKLEVIELRELATELAATMATGGIATPTISAVRERISQADGLIAVTPVFASSYSGLFKMFIDILDPDALNAMPVLIAATAGTPRHSLVLDYAMRPLFTYLRAVIVPTGVFAATEDFGSTGLTDRIHRAAAEFAALVVAEPTSVAGFLQDTEPRKRTSGSTLGALTPFSSLLAGHTGNGVAR
ncbi:oxidoreductase [Nocardia sp. SYP-A9097]|uniref:CE1759 family FMN reductase n=1 Tax=Nocardia sp. SYP-A9097 TaxID=2663237 RepID=UPI00129AB77D|nr:CE1759 family FMN reductase [Nocardia sp. SYP-A9097]MRH90780.1 oxidoreductase [Nocardia sp. SYP-A9097]